MSAVVLSSNNVSQIEEEEALDPRVQIELENLNAATNEINRLESALEEANNSFRTSLNETSLQLQSLSKKLGVCVEKARPYYEVKEKAKKLQLDCQRAAVQYQRANAVHQAARETIALAEERFANLKESSKERKFDSAWQEMLNHATMKVMEAEAQKSANEREHRKRAAAYTDTEKEVQELHSKLKSSINKSRPYFNHRAATQVKLEAQKDRIYKLQKDVLMAKNKYSFTLRNLEQISEEIHEFRRINMKREPGVGAEMDSCEPFIEKAPSEDCLFNSKVDEEHEYWNTLKKKIRDLKSDDNSNEIQNKNNSNGNDSVLIFKDNLSLSYEGHNTNNHSEKSPSETQGTIKQTDSRSDSRLHNKDSTKNSDNRDVVSDDDDDINKLGFECNGYEDKSICDDDDNEERCDSISLSEIIMIDKESEFIDQSKIDTYDQARSEPSSGQVRPEPSGQAKFEPNGLFEFCYLLEEGKIIEKEKRFPELKNVSFSNSNFVSSAVKKLESMAMTCTKMENNSVLGEGENVAL